MSNTQDNIIKILPKLLEECKDDDFFAEVLAETLEVFLDSLASDDFFGTERQCDPRGDFRNGNWSLFGEVQ